MTGPTLRSEAYSEGCSIVVHSPGVKVVIFVVVPIMVAVVRSVDELSSRGSLLLRGTITMSFIKKSSDKKNI